MLPAIRPLALIILAIRFSTCPQPPRMVRQFQFSGDQHTALVTCKQILEDLDYKIDLYAAETGLIVTTFQPLRRDLRRYNYALAVTVTDRIQLYIIANKSIFKRGSERTLGGGAMVEQDPSDRLPYSIQRKIFQPVVDELEKNGYSEIQTDYPPEQALNDKTGSPGRISTPAEAGISISN